MRFIVKMIKIVLIIINIVVFACLIFSKLFIVKTVKPHFSIAHPMKSLRSASVLLLVSPFILLAKVVGKLWKIVLVLDVLFILFCLVLKILKKTGKLAAKTVKKVADGSTDKMDVF